MKGGRREVACDSCRGSRVYKRKTKIVYHAQGLVGGSEKTTDPASYIRVSKVKKKRNASGKVGRG